MQKTEISYSDTGRFNHQIIDYLSRDSKLSKFYHRFPDSEGFAAQIEEKKASYQHRATLVDALRSQHPQGASKSLINRLENDRCFTITTGHQLCLFTGPLYFVYKIVSAINLAESLRRENPSQDFIPVFWMATEDHDFEEANHAHLFDKKVSWESGQGGAVGRMKLTGINDVLSRAEEILGDSPNAQEAMKKLRSAYSSEQTTVAEAMRTLVHEIFGAEEVLVVDGDDPILKKCFAPIMKRELRDEFSNKAIESTNSALKEQDYSLQVTQREINLFYLTDELRERIVRDGEGFSINRTKLSFTQTEMEAEIDQHPERFSPNVVLRPLYQEVILPNLAYIGGGGETSYWFQLKEAFDAAEVPFPILILRNSVMWLSKNETKRLEKLSIKPADLFGDQQELIKSKVRADSDLELSLENERKQVAQVFDDVAQRAEAIDPTFRKMVLAEESRAIKSLEGIEKRLVKAEKQQQSLTVSQINNLYDKLFPGGALQERHQNFFEFYLRYGDDFLNELKKSLNPTEFKLTVLIESAN